VKRLRIKKFIVIGEWKYVVGKERKKQGRKENC